mgnify:CR=1 FL=1
MKRLIKQLEAKKAKMAKLRDELRDLESEVTSYADRCETTETLLRDAIDVLSELV